MRLALLQWPWEATVGWGSSLDLQVAGEDSKDLATPTSEGDRGSDDSQVPNQGRSGAHASCELASGAEETHLQPQVLMIWAAGHWGSGNGCPAN